jgi:putative Holliday junction resolvase
LLGVDYGQVRIGLAVTDPERKIAFPLSIYVRTNEEADAAYFRRVVDDEEIAAIVVGLPLHSGGEEGIKAKEARAFGDWLAQVTQLPVEYFDERFTTVQAESALWDAGMTHKRRRERRDKVAAQMMLRGYLEGGVSGES